ncbi:MAG TPA: LytTR family DNA-binding domain-containing protein [Candidatus Polarisedimenticolaceae bacterium]
MTPLRALIVDDEPLARAELRRLLACHPEIDVEAEAGDVAEAERAVAALDPDVVFLDIQMPGGTGFDLLERRRPRGRVIFVTAYDAHALRAFEVNALDYLLKPVNPERLADALSRLTEPRGTGAPMRLAPDDHLWVAGERGARFVKVRDIAGITGAGDYTEVVTADGRRSLVLRPLKDWERRLPEGLFVRVHRGTIVNLERVDRIERDGEESWRVWLRGIDRAVPMSRRHAARLRVRLG